ncbi:hypothetical protein ACE1OE_10845 [Vibrio sp. E150_011]
MPYLRQYTPNAQGLTPEIHSEDAVLSKQPEHTVQTLSLPPFQGAHGFKLTNLINGPSNINATMKKRSSN